MTTPCVIRLKDDYLTSPMGSRVRLTTGSVIYDARNINVVMEPGNVVTLSQEGHIPVAMDYLVTDIVPHETTPHFFVAYVIGMSVATEEGVDS